MNEKVEDEEEEKKDNWSRDSKPSDKDNDGSHGGNSGSGEDTSRAAGCGRPRGSNSGGGDEGPTRGTGGGHSSRRAKTFMRGLEQLSAPEDMMDVKASIITSLVSNGREHLVI